MKTLTEAWLGYAQRDYDDAQAVQKQIDTFVQRLQERMKVQKVLLYGSALQQGVQPHDIDMVVVGTFPQEDTEGFLYDIYTDIPRSIDFHVYGVSSEEKEISPFLQEAFDQGKVIYAS
jgi:hypothetical protein